MDPVIPLSAAFSNLSLRSGPEPHEHFTQDDKTFAHLNDNETSFQTRGGGDSKEYLTYQDPMGTSGVEENTISESFISHRSSTQGSNHALASFKFDISPQSIPRSYSYVNTAAPSSVTYPLLNMAKRGEKRRRNFSYVAHSSKIPRIEVNTANIERVQRCAGMHKDSNQRYSISRCKQRRVPYDFLRHERDFIFSRRLRVADVKTKRKEEKATKDTAIRFGAFSQLPPELRLMILESARPDPRIVRLLKSKHSSALYSKTPIPGLLHATRESRTVALKWYQLCFAMRYPRLSLADWMRPDKLDLIKPRTYFDFRNDVLYIGCESCYSVFCDACKENIYFLQDKMTVERIILHNSIPVQISTPLRLFYDRTSFLAIARLLGAFNSSLREIMILGPENRALEPQTALSHLKESSQRFDWQQEDDLMTQYVASYKNFRSPRISRSFTAQKVRRMELEITAETTKIYGFMEDRFRGMTFNFSYKKDLEQ